MACGQDPHDCETGVPESCSAECGNKWMPYWKACKGYIEEQFPASMGRKRQMNGGVTMFSDFADMCTETMYGSLYRCTGARKTPAFFPLSLEAPMRLTVCASNHADDYNNQALQALQGSCRVSPPAARRGLAPRNSPADLALACCARACEQARGQCRSRTHARTAASGYVLGRPPLAAPFPVGSLLVWMLDAAIHGVLQRVQTEGSGASHRPGRPRRICQQVPRHCEEISAGSGALRAMNVSC